ncbi:protein AF-10-like isoform X1 [Lytechinus pictus]|uniref:protein AF-10-like isoform X1 n=1 Tax=Lytechinus pictus TaxID=7653 RepID=UPI0030BA24FB
MKEMVGGCCVCGDERGWTENPLVYCDGHGCNVAVHQACYGIVAVPTGPWFCRKCESQERAARVRCELCPQREGALKRTDNGSWAHVVCALYIPEVCFGNVSTMEPILLAMIPHERYNKSCFLCETKGRESKATTGCCMTCNRNGCRQSFHVTCAQQEGLLCEEAGQHNDNVKYTGYCTYHYQKLKKDKDIKTIPPFRPFGANYTPEKDKSLNDRPSDKTKADLKERHRTKSERKARTFEVCAVYNAKDNNESSANQAGGNSTGHSAKFTNANFTETTIVPSTSISEETTTNASGGDSSLILKFRRNTVSSGNGQKSKKDGKGKGSGTDSGQGVTAMEEQCGEAVEANSVTEERTQSPTPSVDNAPANNKSSKSRKAASREPSRTPTPSSVSTTPLVITETVMVKDLPPAVEPETPVADTDSATPISSSSTSAAPGSTSTMVDVEKVSSPSTSPAPDVKSIDVKKPIIEEDRKDKTTILGSGSEKHEKKKHRRQSKESKSSRSHREHSGDDDYGSKKRRRTSGSSLGNTLSRDMGLYSFGQRGIMSQGLSSVGDASPSTKSATPNPDELAIHDVFSTANQSGLLIGPPRPGASRQSQHNSTGSTMPATMEQLLERQWDQSSEFLMQQSSHLDIASLLSCLHQLRQENLRLEQHISSLVQRRDHLLAVNARLSLPLTQGGSIANAMGLGGLGAGGVGAGGVGAGGDNSPGSAGSGSNTRSPRFNNVLHNAQGQDLMSSYGSSHSLNQSLNQSSISLGGSPAHAQSLSQSPSSSFNQSHPQSSLTNHIAQLTSTPVSLNHSSGGVSMSLTTTTTATTTTTSSSSSLGVCLSGARLPSGLPVGHPMSSEANVMSTAQHLHPGHGVRSSPSSHLINVNHSRSSPVPGRTTPSRGQQSHGGGGVGRSKGSGGRMASGAGVRSSPGTSGSISAGTPVSRPTDGSGDGIREKQGSGVKDSGSSLSSSSGGHGMGMYHTTPHQQQQQQQHMGVNHGRHLTPEQQHLVYQMMHSTSSKSQHHLHHQAGGGGGGASQRHQGSAPPPPSTSTPSTCPPNGDVTRAHVPPPSKASTTVRSDRRTGNNSAKDKT